MWSLEGNAQTHDNNYINLKTKGFLIGNSLVDEYLPEGYYYHPIKITYSYAIPILKIKPQRKSNIYVHFEPQFNPVIITDAKNTFEFGINVGFLFHFKASEKGIFYGGIGSGPHYVSINTNLQAKGFNFSDNFIIGYRQLLDINKPLELNIQTRFRHVSNDGLQKPNHGIDNLFIMIGLSKIIESD